MRLLHTADWQLGLRAAQAGDRAAEVRAERIRALGRLVDLARELDVAAVLVAGDVFDRQDVDESVVKAAIAHLECLEPIPTLLLPGNHDPFTLGGVWTRSCWSEVGKHVVVAKRSAEIELLPGLAVYPCTVTQKQSRRDPTAWIPPRREGDDRLRVGLAHGSLDALATKSNFPISRDRVELAGLDYLALGDWHGVSIHGRAAYPGTIEQTSFGERLPGHVLAVDLDPQRCSEPLIEQHRVGRFVWLQLEEEIGDRSDLLHLEERIRTAARPDDLLLRLRLRVTTGETSILGELDRLRADLEPRLVRLEWDQASSLEGEDWQMPEGLLLEADAALDSVLHGGELPSGAPESLLDAEPPVLEEARSQLRRWAREAQESQQGAEQ